MGSWGHRESNTTECTSIGSLIAYVSKTSPLRELGLSCLGPGPEKALNSHPSFHRDQNAFLENIYCQPIQC